MYRPTSAAREPVNTVTLRVSGGTASALQASLDSALETGGISGKVGRIVWAESLVDSFLLSRPRFALLLFGLFTGIALALSTLGLYGVVAYSVTQRSREIGVRAALGADPRAVARLIVGGSLRLVAFGCGVGIVGAYAATRMLTSFLFETSPTDPLSFGVALLLLTVAAVLASFVPMRRAVRIDPMDTLRTD